MDSTVVTHLMSYHNSIVSPPSGPFEPPSVLYRILSSPLKFLASCLYSSILWLQGPSITPPPGSSKIRLVCISDTHTLTTDVPDGDILIHAGDMGKLGTHAEIQGQVDWLDTLPHRYKLVVAGNHDSFLDPRSRAECDESKGLDWRSLIYLQHDALDLDFEKKGGRRLHIYGAPQIPKCGGPDFAFQYERNEDAWSHTVPEGIDVLVTHTPPRHHLDLPRGMGCEWLLKEIWRVQPKVHIFGHVHAGHGKQNAWWNDCQRSYEKVCSRGERGMIRDMWDLPMWMDCLKLLFWGIHSLVWSRLWGGDERGSVLVNAALMYDSTGRLGNSPTIIDI